MKKAEIVVNSKICHGKPVFKGTRVMVWQILELLEVGSSRDEILKAFPSLPEGAVKAALHYAAEQVKGVSYVDFAKDKRIGRTQVFVG